MQPGVVQQLTAKIRTSRAATEAGFSDRQRSSDSSRIKGFLLVSFIANGCSYNYNKVNEYRQGEEN